MSAIGGKADVRELPAVCLLIAKSGHWRHAVRFAQSLGSGRDKWGLSEVSYFQHFPIKSGTGAPKFLRTGLTHDQGLAI